MDHEVGRFSCGTLVLASASQVRRRMLLSAGLDIYVQPSDVDEDEIKQSAKTVSREATDIAQLLAEAKALAVGTSKFDAVVVGADSVLECGGRLFDKPKTRNEAAHTLTQLRGRSHRLISAVAVVAESRLQWSHVDSATLVMRSFSDDFLKLYLDALGEAATTSVGAYHLEGLGSQLFDRIDGDVFTILGLPLLPLMEYLRGSGHLAA